MLKAPNEMTEDEQSAENPNFSEVELAQDEELWNLLGENSQTEVNPLFSRNVVREIRLEESEKGHALSSSSLWKRFLGAKLGARLLIPSAVAAVTVASILIWSSNNSGPDQTVAQIEDFPSELEASLESELLIVAADEPDLFSDEQVISMLF